MNLYRFHSNPSELIHAERKDEVLGNMVRHRLGYTSRLTPALVEAVISQLGVSWGDEGEPDGLTLHDTLLDIYKHGMTGGFTGFTYYGDTKEFYSNNKDAIIEYLEHESLDMGYDVHYDESLIDLAGQGMNAEKLGAMSLVLSFGYTDYSTTDDVYRTMYGGHSSEYDTAVSNSIAWYIAESVASEYYDIMYNEG